MSWVKIDTKVLQEANQEQLKELIILLSKRLNENDLRFDFFFPLTPLKIEQYPNFKNLSSTEQQLIRRSILKAYNSGAKNNPKYYIERGNECKSQFFKFNINEALYFFNQPFSIYIENNLYDKHFVKAIFKFFDITKILQNHVQKGFLTFENSGGIDGIKNIIKSKLEQLSDIDNLNPTFPQKYLNAFAIFDSDKTYPNEVINKNINLINELVELGVGYHMLEKRSMENYLPDGVFDNLDNIQEHTRRWISAYKNLTAQQKDYLKYDKGFGGKNRETLSIEVQVLYSSVGNTNYDILNGGIQLADYKPTVANLFNTPHIYKNVLLERAGGTEEENEFKTLVENISKIL